MPQVLTTNALILCPHGGKGVTAPTDPKWSVNGGTVALEGDPGAITCPFLPLPCLGYTLQSMGLNATQVDGRKVILVTDFNQTFTGLPLIMAEFHQTFDETTPAPIPPGQKAPPASPELTDFGAPLVTSPLSTIPVKLPLPPPPPLTVAFNLSAAHPLKWMLTYINEAKKSHQDWTNITPPGVVVTPPGGNWTAPLLNLSVAIAPPFLSLLAPGKHHLFITGVSKRGLSGHMDVVLEVTL